MACLILATYAFNNYFQFNMFNDTYFSNYRGSLLCFMDVPHKCVLKKQKNDMQ